MDAEERMAEMEAKVASLEQKFADAHAVAISASLLAKSLAATHLHPGAVLATFNVFAASVEGHSAYSQATDAQLLSQSQSLQQVVELLTKLIPPPPSAG